MENFLNLEEDEKMNFYKKLICLSQLDSIDILENLFKKVNTLKNNVFISNEDYIENWLIDDISKYDEFIGNLNKYIENFKLHDISPIYNKLKYIKNWKLVWFLFKLQAITQRVFSIKLYNEFRLLKLERYYDLLNEKNTKYGEFSDIATLWMKWWKYYYWLEIYFLLVDLINDYKSLFFGNDKDQQVISFINDESFKNNKKLYNFDLLNMKWDWVNLTFNLILESYKNKDNNNFSFNELSDVVLWLFNQFKYLYDLRIIHNDLLFIEKKVYLKYIKDNSYNNDLWTIKYGDDFWFYIQTLIKNKKCVHV